jgi:hypothetical protein
MVFIASMNLQYSHSQLCELSVHVYTFSSLAGRHSTQVWAVGAQDTPNCQEILASWFVIVLDFSPGATFLLWWRTPGK